MNTNNVVRALALTNPVALAAVVLVAALVVALLAAFVVLLVVCIYFAVGYVVGRVLLAQFRRRSTHLSFAGVVHDATGLKVDDISNLFEWFESDAIPEQDEHAPLTVAEAAAPYGWTTLDLPTQPTPSGILGHDEYGKGEVIETTLAGEDDRPEAVEPHPVPAQAAHALLAPSANQTTTPAPKKKPAAADRAAQVETAKRLLAEGKPVRAIARDLKVPESTVRSWKKKFAVEANV